MHHINPVTVIQKKQIEKINILCGISDIEEGLPKNQFITIRRGVLINAKYIQFYGTDKSITMIDKEVFYVSRDRKQKVHEFLKSYLV
jgi:DNA-binding LytR/AlgR family response regulator